MPQHDVLAGISWMVNTHTQQPWWHNTICNRRNAKTNISKWTRHELLLVRFKWNMAFDQTIWPYGINTIYGDFRLRHMEHAAYMDGCNASCHNMMRQEESHEWSIHIHACISTHPAWLEHTRFICPCDISPWDISMSIHMHYMHAWSICPMHPYIHTASHTCTPTHTYACIRISRMPHMRAYTYVRIQNDLHNTEQKWPFDTLLQLLP
jgi:hypothetical protein